MQMTPEEYIKVMSSAEVWHVTCIFQVHTLYQDAINNVLRELEMGQPTQCKLLLIIDVHFLLVFRFFRYLWWCQWQGKIKIGAKSLKKENKKTGYIGYSQP